MAWTPPSKLVVVLTFLMWLGGLFIFLDLWYFGLVPWPAFGVSWSLIALILLGLAWLLMFLGVKLKGL